MEEWSSNEVWWADWHKERLHHSIQHCFVCILMAQWVGGGPTNPETNTQALREKLKTIPGGPMKTIEEPLVQRNTHIFMKAHWFGEKDQLRKKLLHNKDWTLSARAQLQMAVWAVKATGCGDSPSQTWTQIPQQGPGKSQVCSMEQKQLRFKDYQKNIPAAPHHYQKRIKTHRHTDSVPWKTSQAYEKMGVSIFWGVIPSTPMQHC